MTPASAAAVAANCSASRGCAAHQMVAPVLQVHAKRNWLRRIVCASTRQRCHCYYKLFGPGVYLAIVNTDFSSSYSIMLSPYLGVVPGSWFLVCHPILTKLEGICKKNQKVFSSLTGVFFYFLGPVTQEYFLIYPSIAFLLLWLVPRSWFLVCHPILGLIRDSNLRHFPFVFDQ